MNILFDLTFAVVIIYGVVLFLTSIASIMAPITYQPKFYFFAGSLLAWVLIWPIGHGMGAIKALQECEKINNVHQCEMVARPASTEVKDVKR